MHVIICGLAWSLRFDPSSWSCFCSPGAGVSDSQCRDSFTHTSRKACSSASFSDLLSNVINSVNDIHQDAATAQDALLAGEPVELHDVMIKAEEAGLATELLLQVRNKLVSAYNEIMSMPV